jgi:hypothetical protein
MPDAPDPITSSPNLPYQPWSEQIGKTVGRWVPVKSGPADDTGHVAGDFEDGPGLWKQI